MALSITFTHHGVTVENGYLKVNQYGGNKENLNFEVDYKSASDQPPLKKEQFTCSLNLSGDNPVAQAYEHLKTLPEFSAAEDV